MLRKPWLITIGLCLSIFTLLALIKFFQIRAAIAFGESFPEPSETVHQEAIAYSKWRPTITVTGEVKAPQEAELRTEVAGVIASVGFLPGAEVKKGDLLLQLDIAEEKARLAALQPQIKLAKKDLDRLSSIKNRQAISQQLIDQARSQLGVVQGEAAAIRESIVNKTVRAPFDGITGLHDFQQGEYVMGGTLVTRIIGRNDELWVDFALPQQYAKVNVGDTIQVASIERQTSKRQGQVTVVESALASTTRTLGARAVIGNLDKSLQPGAFVSVEVPIGLEQTVIRLPSTAVRMDTFGHFVYLLESDNNQSIRAKRQPVTVLASDDRQTILTPTLSESAMVATLGAYKLREGILVNVDQPHNSPSSAASPTDAGLQIGDQQSPLPIDEQALTSDDTSITSSDVDASTDGLISDGAPDTRLLPVENATLDAVNGDD